MADRSKTGNRKFYDIPTYESQVANEDDLERKQEEKQIFLTGSGNGNNIGNEISVEVPPFDRNAKKKNLMKFVYDNVIGREKVLSGPFGLRRVVYCDYTASGRSLKFIEDYIQEQILPEYGNTHTTTSVTSLQTTLFRHEARDIVRNAVNASEHDVVIFTGSGCTAAVHKIIHAMQLTSPPVVFVGPYEHHSNLLPWRELGAEVISVRQTSSGAFDINDLENKLKLKADESRPMIGCFSAASNVTGQIVEVDAITECLHSQGALAFWDYATAAPYLPIDMNAIGKQHKAEKDAVFISPHKFVGGVQSPGILVAKKKLFKSSSPESGGGGGSVFFVRRNSHRYLQEAEVREEAGTPSIVESIRAGMVFQLKQAIGADAIMQREHELTNRAFDQLSSCPSLVLLGSSSVPRLPIFSFVIRHEQSGRFLHHNFVCALLNDLFGIQARGGCACAGPYAQDLLGINDDLAERYENLLLEDSRLDRTHLRRQAEYSENEILRPGFARLNLPFFVDDGEIDFILEALKLVARYGWQLLPQYNFNPETGEWRHKQHQIFKDRKWLGHISYSEGHMKVRMPSFNIKGPLPGSYRECIEVATKILTSPSKGHHIGDQTSIFSPEAEELRWFLLPSEAMKCLNSEQVEKHQNLFEPLKHSNQAPIEQETTAEAKREDARDHEKFSRGMKEALSRNFDQEGDEEPNQPVIHKTYGNDKKHQENSDGTLGKRRIIEYGKDASEIEETVEAKTDKKRPSVCPDGACFIKRKKVEGQMSASESSSAISSKWHSPPKVIFKPTMEAITEHGMLKDRDKVLVCLSGGKDSLSLLHTLRQYKFYAKSKGINFDLGAVTIDPQTEAYDPSPLKPYLASLGVPYFYEEQNILETAQSLPDVASICSFCSRMKRGRIYAAARREGYNVLALGQHLDDLAESFLMSIFHNGVLRTMKASYSVHEGDLRVIRPFIYVREKDLRSFAEGRKLPVIPENCPACFEAPKERHRMKQLLAAQEVVHPRLFSSLQAAIHPILSISKTGVSVRKILLEACQASISGEGDDDEEDF